MWLQTQYSRCSYRQIMTSSWHWKPVITTLYVWLTLNEDTRAGGLNLFLSHCQTFEVANGQAFVILTLVDLKAELNYRVEHSKSMSFLSRDKVLTRLAGFLIRAPNQLQRGRNDLQ